MPRRFLLDTGVLLGFVRKAPWADAAHTDHNLGSVEVMSLTSVICQGELLALSEKFGWGAKRREVLEEALDNFPILGITPDVVRAYALIDAWTHGKPVTAAGIPPPPSGTPAVSMKQNDIWIAASTHVSQATLLSTDKDFEHLHNIWLDYAYVDQRIFG